MTINIGDKVTVRRYGEYQFNDPIYYEVIDKWKCDIVDMWFKLKHPDISGHFIVKLESIEEVIDG